MFAATTKKMMQRSVLSKVQTSITNLIKVIKTENSLLETGAISKLEHICDKKIQLLRNLNEAEEVLGRFINNNSLDKSDSAIVHLQQAFAELTIVSSRNDILLKANIEASAKIIEFCKEAHKQKISRSYSYNNKGSAVAANNLQRIVPATSLNSKV